MSPSRSTTRTRISLSSGAGEVRAPVGLIAAIAIHAVVIIATLFTWEHRLDIADESTPIVPVDLVTIAQKTNIAPAAPKIVEQKPAPQVQPPPLPTPAPPVTEATEVAPAPVPPKAKPQPKPETKKSLDQQMADLLNPLTSKHSTVSYKGYGQQNEMAADLQTMLFNEIDRCWNRSAISGAPHPEQLVVYIELALNPDGSVARPPQLAAQSVAAEAGNPFMRAAADAAVRAINACAPYNRLPGNRYSEWRDSNISFDPSDLAGQ